MILKIGNRDYTLNFGLAFLREMNKQHSVAIEGMATGYGAMTMFNAGQALNDPLALVDVIKASTITEPQKPSNKEIEEYLNDLVVKGKYTEVASEIVNEIKKQPLLKLAMNTQ